MPKQVVRIGADGWLNNNWDEDYYPEDIPHEWKLDYYANELNCVLLTADFWLDTNADEINAWLDAIDDDFCLCLKMPHEEALRASCEQQLALFSSETWLLEDKKNDTEKWQLADNISILELVEGKLQKFWRNDDKVLWQLDITELDGRAQRTQVDLFACNIRENDQLCVILTAQSQQQILDFRKMLELMGIA